MIRARHGHVRGAAGSLRAALVALVLTALTGGATSQQPNLVILGSRPGERLGTVITRVGDMDGDGVRDVGLGLPDARLPGHDTGAVRILSGADLSVLLELSGLGAEDDFGQALADAGDVDGDGLDDLIVGAPRRSRGDEPSILEGEGYVALFSATGARLWLVQGSSRFEADYLGEFGVAVAGVGDASGDGVPDVAVGEPYGRAELVHDHSSQDGRLVLLSGADGSRLWSVSGLDLLGDPETEFAASLAAAGDRNGDGVGDLVVGCSWVHTVPAALVSGLDGSLLVGATPSGSTTKAEQVASLGDVDGDGVDDFGLGRRAKALVFSGQDGSQLLDFDGTAGEILSTMVLADAGDPDGDGLADLLVGNDEFVQLGETRGRVRLSAGGDGFLLQQLDGPDGQASFGTALLALPDGDPPRVLVGVPDLGPDEAGGLLVYEHLGELERLLSAAPAQGSPDDGYAAALASLPDLDGDGRPELLLGAPRDDQAILDAGRVYVLSGGDGAVLFEQAGAGQNRRAGLAVAPAGDVDGDGLGDWAYAEPFGLAPLPPGRVLIRSGADGSLLRTLTGTSSNDWFGHGLALVGDLDGDGRDDLAVGAPQDDAGGNATGTVHLISGATGATLRQITGDEAFAEFGSRVWPAGDLDGDDVPDLLVHSPFADGPVFPHSGSLRAHSGADGSELWRVDGAVTGDRLGEALARLADLDDDGVADLAVGVPGADGSHPEAGQVQVVSGADGSLLWSVDGALPNDAAGSSLAALPDLDDDGVADLAVGAPGTTSSAPGTLSFHSGVDGATLRTLGGIAAAERFATALASVDVDVDGQPDLLVGSAGEGALASPAGTLWGLSPTLQDGAWTSLGQGLAGSAAAPLLTGQGTLEPGPVSGVLLEGGPALGTTNLVIGFSDLSAPFKGGVLVPSPDLLFLGLPLDGQGRLLVAGPWPPGLPPGSELRFQHWLPDPGAPLGLAASNGLLGTTP